MNRRKFLKTLLVLPFLKYIPFAKKEEKILVHQPDSIVAVKSDSRWHTVLIHHGEMIHHPNCRCVVLPKEN